MTNDTQAPGIGIKSAVDFATGNDTTMLTLMIDGKLDHASADGPWGQAILALLAERDLAAAQTAAAVERAFRDGLTYGTICEVTDQDKAWRTSQACERLGDASAALDALIEERVDAMWRECLGALPEMGANPVYPGWLLKEFIANMQAIRARASKEGQL